jgi:hypothetical protein
VDTSSCTCRHGGKINNKVANLPKEIVLVGIPVFAKLVVRIRINDCYSPEGRSSLDGGDIDRIADKLCIVKLDNGSADAVGACWEVDKCWSDSGGIASMTTTVPLRDGVVDCCCIIGNAVT